MPNHVFIAEVRIFHVVILRFDLVVVVIWYVSKVAVILSDSSFEVSALKT